MLIASAVNAKQWWEKKEKENGYRDEESI